LTQKTALKWGWSRTMTRHDMACTPYGDEDGRYDIADPRILSWGTEPETDSE